MMEDYGEKKPFASSEEPASGNFVRAFDAFPKAKPQYITRTSGGGKWTVAMVIVSAILLWSELSRWWEGQEDHTFSVEKGIDNDLQINLDIVVHMACSDLHVNVQDAAGDRILAHARLKEEPTLWRQWVDNKGMHRLGQDSQGKPDTGAGLDEEGFGEAHVHDIVARGRKKARWARTPRIGRGTRPDSCRIYGSIVLNKVQGDFHITARGHGYSEAFAQHLDHSAFNFSHVISELSYGPHHPSLVNPLDRTVNLAETNFHRFQYFTSIVPTIYTVAGGASTSTVFANQYAVTEQSNDVNEQTVPGIFFKYDIEPILLTIEERRDGVLAFLVKIINVLSGVLVAAHWGFTLTEWAREAVGRRRRSGHSEGMIGAKSGYEE